MNKTTRNLLLLSAVLALAASLYIVFSPISYVQVDAVTGQEAVGQISWFEGQGWWGIFILLIFAALYAVPLLLYLRKHKNWTALVSIVALILTYSAGFSIGRVYWPAAGVLILSLLVMLFKS